MKGSPDRKLTYQFIGMKDAQAAPGASLIPRAPFRAIEMPEPAEKFGILALVVNALSKLGETVESWVA